MSSHNLPYPFTAFLCPVNHWLNPVKLSKLVLTVSTPFYLYLLPAIIFTI